MFDTVRNNKKIVQIILALIILPFAFWGVESYIRNAGTDSDVAKVGDSKISMAEFQEALREQQDRMRPALGGRDPAILDSPEIRRAVLDSLVERRLLQLYAAKAHLAVSNEYLARFIASVPSLQVDGQFSPERYAAVVAAQGMSKEMFEHKLRQDLTLQQALSAVADASLAGEASSSRWLAVQMEEREVSEATLRPEKYAAQVKVGPDAVKAFYDANLKRFELPEQLRAEYVVLSRDKLAARAMASEDEIKAWYASRTDRYKQAEERRASHILIPLPKGADAEAAKAAETKAAGILAQVRKSPGDFASLAKQHSQDPGSAANGGDLGWFGRGAMVKPFEDAVFSLKEGGVSDVVKSDFGFHIIRLTGIQPERARPLEEVKGEIAAEIKVQAAAKQYAELAEAFNNTVYEQSDSLAPAAEKFKLTVEKTDWMVKGGAAAGPFANQKLMSALFSDDAVKNKRNTEAVEISPNVLVSARVLEHKPATQQPLEAVSKTIEKLLVHQEAVKLAAKDGEEKLAALTGGGKDDIAWSSARSVSRAVAQNLPAEAVRAIFAADTAKLPAYAGVTVPGGYALFRIAKARPYTAASGETPQAKALRAQYARTVAEEEMLGWLAGLRAKYPVEINQAALEKKDR
jgi:peptidyl-prolyl cis-trans isomerase D